VKLLFKKVAMTPSCTRILDRFESFLAHQSSAEPGHLVLALLLEESLGSKCLNNLGLSVATIADGCIGKAPAITATALIDSDYSSPDVLAFSAAADTGVVIQPVWCIQILDRARKMARDSFGAAEVSSEHLLQAMVDLDGPLKELLLNRGVTTAAVLAELNLDAAAVTQTLEVDFKLNFDESAKKITVATGEDSDEDSRPNVDSPHSSTQSSDRVLALIDANLNRAREGLRVLEDFARFVQRNVAATVAIKQLRHDLVSAELLFRNACPAIDQRDTIADVGTNFSTAAEMKREHINDVVTANARRVQEALRSLEEFGKTVDASFAATIKQLRYRSYAAEQLIVNSSATTVISAMELRTQRLERLQQAQLYLLVTEDLCRLPWKDVVVAALEGGVDVIQLREKELDDDQLIARGRWLAETCEQFNALFIMNDRVDLAVAAGAHGVHLGQDDLDSVEARAGLLDHQLLGLSTHSAEQIRQACCDGVDYLGVGPVFPSQTKMFQVFPGLELVSTAATFADRPWFPIGGISCDNMDQVIEAGAVRIATCRAVIGEADPAAAARKLKQQLSAADKTKSTIRLSPS